MAPFGFAQGRLFAEYAEDGATAEGPPSRKRRGKGGATSIWEFVKDGPVESDLRRPSSGFRNGPGVALPSDLAHDRQQNSNLLFCLRQLRNHFGKFIEYLVPAFHLTAIFRALHGFISNEGEFRPAVSQILKEGDVVRTLYGLMFYSQLRRINLVSLRVRKVHQGNDLLVRNNLVVFNRIPELLPIRRLHAAEKFSSHTKIHLANRRSKTFRSPPLHHVLRVCPRLPNQFAWGIKNSCDNHPLNLVYRAFCHVEAPLFSFESQPHPAFPNSLPRTGDS